ncbi:hypothetical protein [Candidatus Protochlamydia sp. W-9]|uniref:hypothetical protein n=1 Tax=Candidatus Protochlamydia sp. W-9 TaxID=1785087 RepID=UPI00096A99D9|nr:hypothetical protein [Candidatus Protochlamydia sp. W-9]
MTINTNSLWAEQPEPLSIALSPPFSSINLQKTSLVDKANSFEKTNEDFISSITPSDLPTLIEPNSLTFQTTSLQKLLEKKIQGATEIVEEALKLLNPNLTEKTNNTLSKEVIEMKDSLQTFLKLMDTALTHFHPTRSKMNFLETYDSRALINAILKLSEIRVRFSQENNFFQSLFKTLPAAQIKILAPLIKFTFEEICQPLLKLNEEKKVLGHDEKINEDHMDTFKLFWKSFLNKEISFEQKEIHPLIAQNLSFLPLPQLANKMLSEWLLESSLLKPNSKEKETLVTTSPVKFNILPFDIQQTLDLLLIKIIIHQALGFVMIHQINPLFDPFDFGLQVIHQWLKERIAELLTNNIDGYTSLDTALEKNLIKKSLIVFALIISIGYAEQSHSSRVKIAQTLKKIASHSNLHEPFFYANAALILIQGCEKEGNQLRFQQFIRYLAKETEINGEDMEKWRLLQYLLIEMMKKISTILNLPLSSDVDPLHKENYFSMIIQG